MKMNRKSVLCICLAFCLILLGNVAALAYNIEIEIPAQTDTDTDELTIEMDCPLEEILLDAIDQSELILDSDDQAALFDSISETKEGNDLDVLTDLVEAETKASNEYTYDILYKENGYYEAVKSFNWHTGPSVSAPTADHVVAGTSFWVDAAVWNKTTNNMWLKKKGEEKYVFAGLHYANDRWYVDETQTQYLYFINDKGWPTWNGCNLNGATLEKGKPFALSGSLDSDITIKSVKGEFFKGQSCWGNPTAEFPIYSTNYSLYGSELDMALKFGSLSEGDYKLYL